jgi:hypothetical protein
MRNDREFKKGIGDSALGGLQDFFSHVENKDIEKRRELSDEDNPFGWVDVLTFTRDSYYLGESITLRPWQRLILKIFYMGTDGNKHLELLSDPVPSCEGCVWNNNDLQGLDSPCVKCPLWTISQKESFLYEEMRKKHIKNRDITNFLDEYDEEALLMRYTNEIQLMDYDLKDKPDILNQLKRKINKEFMELVLVLGRRSGKSLIASILALYEVYKLLETGNPQEYLGLAAGDPIAILNVAGAKTQAQESVFEKIRTLALNSSYFKKYINPDKVAEQSIRFWTPFDKERAEQLKEEGFPPPPGSLILMSGTSNVSSQVGKTLAVVIIDEVAEMIKNSESKMSDVQLYNKLGASVGTFGTKGKIITISNPLGAEGLLWDLYHRGIAEQRDENGDIVYDPLVFQLSSKKCNPAISDEFLRRERLRLKSEYGMQYDAEFSEGSSEPWLPADIINKAFVEDLCQINYGLKTQRYYAHVDAAINTDNFAFVILHPEDTRIPDPERGGFKNKIVVDHIKIWIGTKEKPVKFSEVDEYIIRKCREFKIKTLSYDAWQSEYSFQNMRDKGIPVLKTSFNNAHKSKIYETLRDLFIEGLVEIPTKVRNPMGQYEDAPNYYETKDEFLYLEKKYHSSSHTVGKSKGHNDDITDCIAGATWVALRQGHTGVRPSIRTARLGLDAGERAMGVNPGIRQGYSGQVFPR